MRLLNGASDVTLSALQTKEVSEEPTEKEEVAGGTDQQDGREDGKDDVVGEYAVCPLNTIEISPVLLHSPKCALKI